MGGAGRVTVFFAIVLSVWTAMHAYVFWRAASVPAVSSHLSRGALVAIAAFLWLCYPLARALEHRRLDAVGRPLELVGSTWMGVLVLAFFTLLALDLVTLGGYLVPRLAPTLRGWALMAAGGLAVVALAQGMRAPVVVDYQVTLPNLPPGRDGTVLVELSDMHLGTLIGERWLARLVDRVDAMRPDLIVVDGDLIDGDVPRVEPMVPTLQRLHAPLGVWAVTGNHEFYAGLRRSVHLFEQAGFHVLEDGSAEAAPGLVLAGVDDLTARRQFGLDGAPVERALKGRSPGATIFLSHTPWDADRAAALGAGLMLCGHTHDGQIWPFGYLVRLTYPLLGGRYLVGGMPVIVCRGTGTWGPRMRLWRPSEIVRVTLRATTGTGTSGSGRS